MKASPRSAFTLLEILVAVALLGALLLAMNIFVFSMAEIWGRGGDQRLFDQHVRAVTRHVEQMVRSAMLAPAAPNATAPHLSVREVRGAGEPLLIFEQPAGDRVLAWPGQPLPDVVCAIAVRPGQGLGLYWHSQLETRFAEDPPRLTVLTPFGAGIAYDYYEPGFRTWQRQSRLQKDREGKWLLPDRLVLRFVRGELSAETTVALPTKQDGLPVF